MVGQQVAHASAVNMRLVVSGTVPRSSRLYRDERAAQQGRRVPLDKDEGRETTDLTRPPARTFPTQKFLPPTLQIIFARERTMELQHSNPRLCPCPAPD